MTPRKKKAGRPRKLRNRDIARHKHTEQLYGIVGHHMIGSKSEYRCIPLNGRKQPYGRAIWIVAPDLEPTGEVSRNSLPTVYNANAALDDELDGRGCDCQCCIHTVLPHEGWTYTGKMRDYDDE